jgi:hypothetical protein
LQSRLLARSQSAGMINGLGVLHGRLDKFRKI